MAAVTMAFPVVIMAYYLRVQATQAWLACKVLDTLNFRLPFVHTIRTKYVFRRVEQLCHSYNPADLYTLLNGQTIVFTVSLRSICLGYLKNAMESLKHYAACLVVFWKGKTPASIYYRLC